MIFQLYGVTGSVGKTSTKDLISSVMSKKYKTLKTSGNYNNHIGVPLTVLGLNQHESAVIEMGMSSLGEIEVLTSIARPTISVITNIGTAHIGKLGSRENILKAKLEILEGMEQDGVLVINNDNDLLHEWYLDNKDKYNVITYGVDNESDIMASNIVSLDNGSRFDVKINGKVYNAQVNVGGKHFVMNSLCAICVGMQCDIPAEKILEGIFDFELTKNRMEIVRSKSLAKIINDTYNASYDSMKASLECLKNMNGNRKIAVLGDILELGNFASEIHEKVGEEVYRNEVEVLVTVGENARLIADSAIRMGMQKDRVFSFVSNDEAVKLLNRMICEGDCVLVKASNGMRFCEIVEQIV